MLSSHSNRPRNLGLRFAGLFAILIVVSAAGLSTAAANDRPNIVLMMADDMGFSDLGVTGGEIDTPSLDRLAAEGQLWLDFNNNAKCTTTRVSLLTGRYPRRPEPHLSATTPTIADTLASAGYTTVHSGKWHLAGKRGIMGAEPPFHPLDRGFQHSYGLLDGCCNFFDPSIRDPEFKGGRLRNFFDGRRQVTEFAADFYTTDAFTDYALERIDNAVAAKTPFFVHLCFTAPHYPLHAPPELIEKYRGRYRDGWTKLREQRFERQAESGLFSQATELPGPNSDVKPWDSLSDEEQNYFDHLMATYAAMVERMDTNIGRVLDRLDSHDITDKTIVLFLSDNGGCAEKPGGIDRSRTPGVKDFYTAVGPGWAYAQNTPYRRYKSWTHEGGVKTPLIVRWPGQVEPGTRTRQTGHVIDLHSTLADAAGTSPSDDPADPSSRVEGRSLVPAFRGGTVSREEPLFWEWAGSYGVRDGNWKAIRPKKRDWELYDLGSDPTELRDLAQDHPERLRAMTTAWDEWNSRMRRRP